MPANPYESPRELAAPERSGDPRREHPYLIPRGVVGGACFGSMAAAGGTVLIKLALLLLALAAGQSSFSPEGLAPGPRNAVQWNAVGVIAGIVAALIPATLAGVLFGGLLGWVAATQAVARPALRGRRLVAFTAAMSMCLGAALGVVLAYLEPPGSPLRTLPIAVGAAIGGLTAAIGGAMLGRRLFPPDVLPPPSGDSPSPENQTAR